MKPTLVQAILHPQFRAYSSATACRHCKPTAQHRQAWPYEPPLCSPLLPSFVTDSPDNPHCPQSSAAPEQLCPTIREADEAEEPHTKIHYGRMIKVSPL